MPKIRYGDHVVTNYGEATVVGEPRKGRVACKLSEGRFKGETRLVMVKTIELLPDAAEIRRRCAIEQEGWTETDRRRRAPHLDLYRAVKLKCYKVIRKIRRKSNG